MDFIIPAQILGTDFSLQIKENNSYKRIYSKDIYNYKSIVVNSEQFLEKTKLYGLEVPTFLPDKFTKPYKELIYGDDFIPWFNCIPNEFYKENLKRYVSEIKNILSQDFSYYDILLNTNRIFSNLFPANINIENYNSFLTKDSNLSTNSVLKTFTPTKNVDGLYLTEEIKYSRLLSKTGRLVVTKGPQILHLKQEYRKIITSRYDNGEIYYLDYKSLEPRVLLSKVFPNEDIAKDIYTDALYKLSLDKKISRSTIKIVLLSIINGAGEREIIKQLSNNVEYPEDLIKLVIKYFKVDELRETLSDEYKQNGGKLIYNHFKRPIICSNAAPYILLNYFIQSTAVDVALIGFNKICDKIINANLTDVIVPIFILHDALILDVSPEIIPFLEKFATIGNRIEGFDNIKFWIELEKLNK